jgi:hypothetical protein
MRFEPALYLHLNLTSNVWEYAQAQQRRRGGNIFCQRVVCVFRGELQHKVHDPPGS